MFVKMQIRFSTLKLENCSWSAGHIKVRLGLSNGICWLVQFCVAVLFYKGFVLTIIPHQTYTSIRSEMEESSVDISSTDVFWFCDPLMFLLLS